MKLKKSKYDTMFNVIRNELNKIDPLGVVLGNKNLINEYDFETLKILEIIHEKIDYKDFSNKICEIFIQSTEMDFKPENFYDCAKNILKKLETL